MKKTYIFITICFSLFLNIKAQSQCTISLSSSPGTDTQKVCSNAVIQTITYSFNGTGCTASGLPAGVSGTIVSAGIYQITGTPTVDGIHNYTVTTSGGCSPDTSITGIIIVGGGHITQSGSDNQAACKNANINPIRYSIVGGVAQIYGIAPGISYSMNASNDTLTMFGAGPTAGSYSYTLNTSGGTCATSSLFLGTIQIDAPPTATAGGSTSICENMSATISGASVSDGTINWTHNGAGTLTNVTTLTPTYAANSADAGSSITLTMTVTSSNSCSPQSASASYYINVDYGPVATAGGSTTICENSSYTLTNGEATKYYGTALWTENGAGSITGGTTTLMPQYTANAGDAGNSVTLTMTVTGLNGCITQTSTAQYTVNVDHLPLATAGGLQTICENSSATVSGASLMYGVPSWTENGTGSITSGANGLTPTYAAAAGDAASTVTLTMTVTSTNTCSPQTATAKYYMHVDKLPTASTVGSATICSAYTLANGEANASNGSINWTHDGLGSLTNATTLNPKYQIGSWSEGSTIVTLTMTVTSTNSCNPQTASATYIINIDSLPDVEGYGDTTICVNENVTVMGANARFGTVNWTHNGFGVLTNPTSLTPTYIPASGDADSAVKLTITVSSNNACHNNTAYTSYTVNVDPLPVAIAGGNASICENGSITVFDAAAYYGSMNWTHNGTGTINNSNTLTPTYVANLSDAGGSVTLTMTVTSTNSCNPQTSYASFFVVVGMRISNNSGSLNQNVCTNAAIADIIIDAVFNGATIAWSPSLPTGIFCNYDAATSIYTISGIPTVPGSYSYTVTNTGCSSQSIDATGIINVVALPNASVLSNNESSSGACNGYLEAVCNGSAPFTYVWSDSANVNSAYRFHQCVGNYSVTVTDNAGCSATTQAFVLSDNGGNSSVNPVTIIAHSTGETSVGACDGTATVQAAGGVAPYSIYIGGQMYTGSTATMNSLCEGFYTVTVNDAQSNCTSVTFVVGSPATTYTNLPISPLPAIDTIVTNAVVNCIINYGAIDSINITDYVFDEVGSVTVTWSIYQGSTIITQQAVYPVTTAGLYAFILDVYCTNRASGSIRAIDELEIEARTSAINSLTEEDVKLFPNPFNNKLVIEIGDKSTVKITDISGKVAYKGSVNTGASTIETNEFASGVYFITITNTKGRLIKKLIKN